MVLTVSIAAAILAAATSQPSTGKHHAVPTLIPETLSVTPGSTTRLLVDFKIEDPWHLYWDGQNDTGQPPRCTWKLPEGWTISEPTFPAPHRNIQPGGIVDYIYEKHLTLVYTLSVPKDTTVRSGKISADLEWLECSNVCLFGAGKIQTVLPLEMKPETPAKPNPGATAPLDALTPLLPKPFSEAKDASLAVQDSSATITVKDAIRLEYFSGNKSSTLKDAVTGASADGPSLTMQFTTKGEAPIVDGIVAVYRTKQGPPAYYLVSSALASPAATEPAASPIKR